MAAGLIAEGVMAGLSGGCSRHDGALARGNSIQARGFDSPGPLQKSGEAAPKDGSPVPRAAEDDRTAMFGDVSPG